MCLRGHVTKGRHRGHFSFLRPRNCIDHDTIHSQFEWWGYIRSVFSVPSPVKNWRNWGASHSHHILTLQNHYQQQTVNTMWPATFMTGVNWQLSKMMTASNMSVVVSGNGGTRQVAPSIFPSAILQAVGLSLITICSCCLALGLGLLIAICSTKTVSREAVRGVTTKSTQPRNQ